MTRTPQLVGAECEPKSALVCGFGRGCLQAATDTDHMSVLERSDQLRARLAHVPPAEVVATIISYEE
jgi:hypothetical protein